MMGELLADTLPVSQYIGTLPPERLDLWLEDAGLTGSEQAKHTVKVDDEIIAEALSVLTAALHSEDAERRERAAAAILYYAK